MVLTTFQKVVAGNLKARSEGEVSTELKIHSGDGIFSGTASFTFLVKNDMDIEQNGRHSKPQQAEGGRIASGIFHMGDRFAYHGGSLLAQEFHGNNKARPGCSKGAHNRGKTAPARAPI